MPRDQGPVTTMFLEMVDQGFIHPTQRMEDLRFPGELNRVPTIVSYGTPAMSIRAGDINNAKLGQRS